jgi:hypothetical protein
LFSSIDALGNAVSVRTAMIQGGVLEFFAVSIQLAHVTERSDIGRHTIDTNEIQEGKWRRDFCAF